MNEGKKYFSVVDSKIVKRTISHCMYDGRKRKKNGNFI